MRRRQSALAQGAFELSTSHAVRAATVALLALLVSAESASAATDHVVTTGGAVISAGRTADDVVVVDGPVRIAGRATGVVVSVSGPIRVTGRVDGDLIAVSDRAFLGPTARVGGDLRYGDERRCWRAARGSAARSATRTGPTPPAGGVGSAGWRGDWRCPCRR
jgi:hypothetical protein